MDTDAMGSVGSTLLTSDTALRDCAVATAHAGALALGSLGGGAPGLAAAVREFVAAHLTVIDAAATASAALARKLSWAAQSAHELELSVATDLGSAGQPLPAHVPAFEAVPVVATS